MKASSLHLLLREFEDGQMKVSINRDKCIGCDVCEATCPDVFKLAEDGKSSVVEKHRKGSLGEAKWTRI